LDRKLEDEAMGRDDKYLGRTIDNYEIVRLLGRGGMGGVFLAFDRTLRRQAALKVLADDAADDVELVKRFEREARIVAEMNHPNIAQVYGSGTIDGVPYYAMEFIEGQSLADMIQERGRLGGTECLEYILQAAKGLQVAAKHDIIHRDVKPANLMVNSRDVVKVVDFGIAKVFRDETFKTATGQVMGTPRYMSPEQGKGQKVDLRSDIYSLGATFYHCVTGQPPFDSDNAFTLIMKHIEEPVRAITDINPNVPEKVCHIVDGMLSKNPAERFQDYSQLIITLENAMGRSQGIKSCVSVGPMVAPIEVKPKSRKAMAATLVALGLVVLLTVLAQKRSQEEGQADQETAADKAVNYADHLGDGLEMWRELRKIRDEAEGK
jgi:serine/threonine protein kinase